MSLKLSFEKETHLSRQRPQTFAELRKLVDEQFKALPPHLQFFYYDEDSDKISVSSDDDLKTLYESIASGRIPKIFIDGSQSAAQQLGK
jgi:hypothetical protein